MGTIGDIFGFIAAPLYYAISGVMILWHELFTKLGLDEDGGLGWALSIIGLTLVIRAALIPLFVRQIKASRNMQLIQPKVRELQKKYGHDRERLAQETMKLYKDSGTNPFASCLPILLQMPIFFTLFSLLNTASRDLEGRGFLTDERARNFGQSELFGRIPIAESFWGSGIWRDGGGDAGVMVLALFLVLAMTATTFFTQRQLMSKNMPADALSGPYAQQQKLLLYVLPVAFGLGGVAFPIGVLLYWTTSNLWTMGQQFYVIRNNPAPGTPAFKAKEDRDRAKAVKRGETPVVDEAPVVVEERRPARREQPQRQPRAARKKGSPAKGGGPAKNQTQKNQKKGGGS